MIYILYGALGAVGVLLVMGLGAAAGWKGHEAWIRHTRRAVAAEADEEERRVNIAAQKAFTGMLNYNAEMAYGMQSDLDELGGEV